jgi:hypothetical protein
MSQENVEIVEALVRAFRAGEWDEALRIYDEAAELDLTRLPGGGVYRGQDGVRDFFTRWVGSWQQFEAEPLEFIDRGDVVIAVMRIRAVGLGSGAPVTMRSADVYTVANGRVVRHVGYPDASEALEAAGLREQATATTHGQPRIESSPANYEEASHARSCRHGEHQRPRGSR